MLPSPYRLTKRSDFQKVYRSRSAFFDGPLLLKASPNQLKISRLGFSLEKRYFRSAVSRNKTKRVLIETVHSLLGRVRPGFDIAIIWKPRGAEKTAFSQNLSSLTTSLLKKSNLLE
jgi:ribonuclease P protein component